MPRFRKHPCAYQIEFPIHSKNAIASGGLFGYGWGKGIYVTSGLLPDRHNDFVFSIIAHQWGLFACLLVLACFAAITMAGVAIASATSEPFARLLAVGLTALIATQALVNVGMTVGLMPITGMTLPFVSYGGSSLLTNFVAVALLISISKHRPYLLALKPFEFGKRKRKPAHLVEPGEASPDPEREGSVTQTCPGSSGLLHSP
ncbi:MAG: FtsW/RodA/SpoVE family cell cycle protein [Planctomycetes bacterium]|nr:FtsW/RodA/SpoVE family cell cycle protein [Planctomycetota bacterium]